MIVFTSTRWPNLVATVGSRVLQFVGDRFEAGPEDALLMRHWMKQHPKAGVIEGAPAPTAKTAPPMQTATTGPSMDMTRAQLAEIATAQGIEPGRMTKTQLLEAIEGAHG